MKKRNVALMTLFSLVLVLVLALPALAGAAESFGPTIVEPEGLDMLSIGVMVFLVSLAVIVIVMVIKHTIKEASKD